MSYTKATDFSVKDALLVGNPSKIVRGSEIDAEFDAIQVADALNMKSATIAASGGSDLVGFIQSGTGAVAATVQDKLREFVSVKDFGAVGDGVTNDTTAITNAIATGKDIYFPAGTYMTTGGHRLSTNRQRLLGADGATIKRLSGTNYLIDTSQGAEVVMENFRLDGNGLAGSLLIWRGHYSRLSRIRFQNSITNYALWISGCNVSQFDSIDFVDSCFGGVLIDNANDSGGGTPAYGCLYSDFNQISCGTTSGGSCIKFAPGSSNVNLSFNNCLLEANNGGVTNAIDLDATLQKNIVFNNLRGEYAALGAHAYINVRGNESINIQFNGGNLTSNAANTARVFSFNTLCRNIGVRNIHFSENPDTPSLAGRTLIEVQATRNAVFENNDFQFINNFVFLLHDTGGASSYITDRSNNVATDSTFLGTGSNTYIGVDYLLIEHSNLTSTLTSCTNVTQKDSSGTWNPTLASGTCSGTAYYVRQGNLCHIYGSISHTGDGSGTTGVTINNLPFASKNGISQYGFAANAGIALDGGDTYPSCVVSNNSTNLVFFSWPSGSGLDASRWLTGALLIFNITYEIA